MINAKASKLAGILIDYLKGLGELEILPEIISLLSKKAGTLGLENAAIVSSPVKLGASESKSIAKFIQNKYGDDLHIIEKVDPSLIAGFTIKVGDEVIDSSLASKLENIRKELA